MTKHKLRIVYMGTPDFAVLPLQKIVEAGYEVVGVITNPDKPAGRGQKLQESAVKKYALEAGLKILQPEKFRDEHFLAQLADLKADLQLVVAFKMLPEIVWNMPSLGTVNLHASLLPDYRGAAPINWAVINGEKFSGVTTFLLKHEIDSGNIIFQQRVEMDNTTTAGELYDKLMHTGAGLLLKTVDAIESGQFPLLEQTGLLNKREPRTAPKIFKEDMQIHWDKNITHIYNLIRGLSPFPTAWTELVHKENGTVLPLKIYSSLKIEQQHNEQAGKIVTDGKKTFDILVSGGVIRVTALQLSGKKRMQTEDFLRGFRLDEYRIQ